MSYLLVDESSQYFYHAASPVPNEPFTMACWVYRDEDTDGTPMSIGEIGNNDSFHRLYVPSATDLLQAGTYTGGDAVSASTVTLNTWEHYCGVWETTSKRTSYLNGVGGDPNLDSGVHTTDNFRIGVSADLTPYGYWSGKLAECAIWNAALTIDEIASLAKGFSPLFIRPQNLIAYYPMLRNYNNVMSGYALNVNDTPTVDVHPFIIYPAFQQIFMPAEVSNDVEVSATLDTLVITEYAATVNAEISFTAGLDTLVITEYVADVNLNVSVTATLDTLVITEYAATVNAEVSFTAGLDPLVITEYAAVVSLGLDVDVTATLDALVITEYAADVNLDVSVAAGLDALVITEYDVNILLWQDVVIEGIDAVTGKYVNIVGRLSLPKL